MLDEATLAKVGKHGMIHTMGMCTCPCFDALVEVGEALKRETALRVRLAKASPEVLAALTLGAQDIEEPGGSAEPGEGPVE